MGGLALAASACLAWGWADFVLARSAREHAALVVLAVSQVAGLGAVLGVTLALGGALPGGSTCVLAAAAGLAELVGLAALARAFARGPVSVVAPLSSLGGLLPLALAVAGGGVPHATMLAALAVALTGAALAGAGERGSGGAVAEGVAWALVASAAFGLFFVLLAKAGSDSGGLWTATIARVASSSAVVALVLVRRPAAAPTGGRLGLLMAMGVVDAGANVLYATAAGDAPTAVIGVLGSLSPVATVLLAVVLLRERPAPLQAAGVAITLVAIAVLGAGGAGG